MVVDEIVKNAERLIRDADCLRAFGSLATAASLYVLAMEECGKACLVRWIAFGYKPADILKEIRTGHLEKQMVYMAHLQARALLSVADVELNCTTNTVIRYVAKVGDLREGLAQALYKNTHFHDLTVPTGLYDHIKQAGFYVDLTEQLAVAPKAFKDGGNTKNLSEDARDTLAMAKADEHTQRVTAILYFAKITKRASSKHRKETLEGIVERLSTVPWIEPDA